METNVKTFRYTYILKNLGMVYLLFLAIGFWLTFAFDGPIFFLLILLGVGIIATIIYITTSVTISNEEISGKTLIGSKVMMWSEIGAIKSTNSSFRLVSVDNDISIRVNSRLDGYATIFDLLYQKRTDLFEYNKHSPFSRRGIGNIVTVTFQVFLLVVSIANLIFNSIGSFRHTIFIFVGIASIYALIKWFYSPQGLTIDSNSLTIKYLNKTDLYSKDDIASISFSRGQAIISFKNSKVIIFSLAGLGQSPFVVYSVLKHWHPDSLAK